jgi:hypothetical protein
MAKKKWDENKVSRDESGRFVSQGYTQVPQMGGQGSNPAYQRQLQGHQRRLQMLQNMNNGTHWQTPAPNYHQQSSSTRRRKGSSGLA